MRVPLTGFAPDLDPTTAGVLTDCDGIIPTPANETDADSDLLFNIGVHEAIAARAMSDLALGVALESVWQGMSAANLYFAEQAPWTVRKTDPVRANTILYYTVEAIKRLAIMAQWAIPSGANAILDLLSQPEDRRGFADAAHMIEAGRALPMPVGIFPRLELPA